MLPSTGKFKEINCPFFDSGLCERPYCHFRHVKKEFSDALQTTGAINSVHSTLALGDNGKILQQLVSEAVRKVLERTELPSALGGPSDVNNVENVSRHLVTKVAEVLVPSITASSSQKTNSASSPQFPSYKPTPIAVLKSRHIPIPYSPSLTKTSSVLRKRSSTDEGGVAQPKFKKDEFQYTNKSDSLQSTPSTSKLTETSTPSGLICDVSNSASTQYSPAPIKGWKDNGLKYTPSAIDSLIQNPYIPYSCSSQITEIEYEPSEKSESSVEPTYEPLATNGSVVGSAYYEPSGLSNSEPEYQPVCCDNTAKAYVPTDISKLECNIDISPEIDLLHDLLSEELKFDEERDDGASKCDFDDRDEKVSKNVDNEKISPSVDKPKKDKEKYKSDSKRKLESEKRKSEDKKRSDGEKKGDSRKERDRDKKEDVKKDREHDKKKDYTKKSSDSAKKHHESEITKKKTQDEKKKGDDKKRSDSRKRSEHSENERKHSEDKKSSSEKKYGDSHHRKTETSKRKGESDKKKSENEMRKSDSEKRKLVSGKDSSNEKHLPNSHSIKNVSLNSDLKTSEKNSSNNHTEHGQSTHKSSYEKKKESITNHSESHRRSGSVQSRHNHHNNLGEEKHSNKEHSKSKTTNSKRKRSGSLEHSDRSEKNKTSNKCSKLDTGKRLPNIEVPDESNLGNSVSDSEGSEMDILDSVTLPEDTWASDPDEDSVTKECYKIFQEYEPDVTKKPPSTYQPPAPEALDNPVQAKRRVAHEGASNTRVNRLQIVQRSSRNPSQILSERFQKARESYAQAQAQTQALAQMQAQAQGQSRSLLGSPPPSLPRSSGIMSPPSQSVPGLPLAGGKKRIAHVPNVPLFLDAKMKMQQKLKEQQLNAPPGGNAVPPASAQTVPKGSQRVAHMPSERFLSRPVIRNIGGKIPVNVRQTYLDILVDEYLKICSSEKEAYEKAEEEEKLICNRSTTRAIYTSHVSNTVNRLRKAAQNNSVAASGALDAKVINRTVSHTSMLAGKVGTKGSWSIEKPKRAPQSVSTKTLYEHLLQFIMTEEQLKMNGFPMSHSEEKGVAVIHNFYKKPYCPSSPLQRMCARCSKIYYVNQQGYAVKEELCVYHWGRLFQTKTRGGWEARYNCCQGHGEAIGCCVGSCHVSDNFDPNNLRGFVKTLPKENPPPDGDYGVYALDCEMCYTTVGLELTRVTVISSDLKVVYETLVKPESTILDYNTRFSGIKEEDLSNITTNIYEVQSVLLSFINDKTILVGHSLESDFKALKLIHSTVVDTSVVYPHKMGPPKKRALKTLCRDLLQKIIQENEGGHDSAEDARAAMEVMLFRVKEEMKTAW